MRDRYDNDTNDLWGEPPPPLTSAGVLTRRPHVRIQGTCVVLVEHPALPPIGFSELRRLGSIAAVLKARIKHHMESARNFTYQNSAELPGPNTAEGMRHVIIGYRYSDALRDFEGR